METYRIYDVYDAFEKRNIKAKIFMTKHTVDRLKERSSASEEDFKTVINDAVSKIVNNYPHENCDYVVTSLKHKMRMPFEVRAEGDNIRIYIPTVLSGNMKQGNKERFAAKLTVEDLSYMLYKEILI